jgi:hypothetical protein
MRRARRDSATTPLPSEAALGRLEGALEDVLRGHRFREADHTVGSVLAMLQAQAGVDVAELDRARVLAFEVKGVLAGEDRVAALRFLDAGVEIAKRDRDVSRVARLAVRRGMACAKTGDLAGAAREIRRAEPLVAAARDAHLWLELVTVAYEACRRNGDWTSARILIAPLSARFEPPEWQRIRMSHLALAYAGLGDRRAVEQALDRYERLDGDKPHPFFRHLHRITEVHAFLLDPYLGDAEHSFREAERLRILHGFDTSSSRSVARFFA